MRAPVISCDLHLHTSFSEDSKTPMEQMVLRGIALGMKTLCFTEHLDADYPAEDGSFSLDLPAYRETFLSLRKTYGDRIELLWGIELGMQPHLGGSYRALIAAWPFDCVLASQHLVCGRDPWYRAFWDTRLKEAQGRALDRARNNGQAPFAQSDEGKEALLRQIEEEIYREYFRLLLSDLKALEEFDVCAHLDYIVRYGPNRDRYYSYEKYRKWIDPILEYLIQTNSCLEVNTSQLASGFSQPNPSADILRRYFALGGRNISIGSDAHEPARLGAMFDTAHRLLREIGFSHLCVFRKRQPERILL